MSEQGNAVGESVETVVDSEQPPERSSEVEIPETMKPKREVYGENPDVTYFFPNDDGANILVEKHRLARVSDYFRTQLPKSDTPNGDRKSITDISFETFNIFIKYIYDDGIEVTEQNYQQILYIASMYFVYDLIYIVVKYLFTFITVNNIVEHFEAIDKFDIQSLEDHMKKICNTSPLMVLKKLSETPTPSYKRILEIILQCPALPCTEFELYTAIVEAIRNNIDRYEFDVAEKMREEIGKLIYLIRFPTMSVDELIECAKFPSLLIEKEILDFILWVKNKKFTYTTHFYSTETRSKVNFYEASATKPTKQ